MTAHSALAYYPDGRLIPFGRVLKTVTENFDSGALPSWLSMLTGGTEVGATAASFGAIASTEGYLRLTTAAATGSRATLAGSAVDLSKMTAARITVQGCYCSPANGAGVSLGIWGANNPPQYGGRINQAYTGGVANGVPVLTSFHSPTGQTDLNMDSYAWQTSSESTRRRNLSFLVVTGVGGHKKGVYAMEDDQVIWWNEDASLGIGVVQPKVRIEAPSNAAVSMTIEQIVFERWMN